VCSDRPGIDGLNQRCTGLRRPFREEGADGATIELDRTLTKALVLAKETEIGPQQLILGRGSRSDRRFEDSFTIKVLKEASQDAPCAGQTSGGAQRLDEQRHVGLREISDGDLSASDPKGEALDGSSSAGHASLGKSQSPEIIEETFDVGVEEI